MKKSVTRNEDVFTGLELVVVISALMGMSVRLLIYLSSGQTTPGQMRMFPEGSIAESAYQSSDHLESGGNFFGFLQSAEISGIQV